MGNKRNGKEMIRTVSVPAGIGDSIWVLSKLINTGEKFIFHLPDGIPQRGKQVFELLPSLVHSCSYVPGLSYNKLSRENIQNVFPIWKRITAPVISVSMNHHLEGGKRIETFFPDLATSYKLPWTTSKFAAEVAEAFPADRKYIGIYGSSYNTTRAWEFWEAPGWFELIQLIHEVRPDIIFVLIGAAWDLNLSGDLANLLTEANIPFIDTVGNGLGWVGEMMKRLSFAFYFPSGLPIFSESLGASDCLMFYPENNATAGIKGTWADPARVENGNFTEQFFNTPQFVFDWFKKIYKFETRL